VTAVERLDDYTVGRLAELGDGRSLLPVRADGGLILLGPVFDGTGVCVACAEDARLAVLGPGTPRRDPRMRLGGRCAPAFVPLIDQLIERIAAAPADYRGTVVAVRTDLGTVATHTVRPRPDGCPVCGPLPADSAGLAAVAPVGVPVTAGALRGENPRTTVDGLRAALLDARHGPVTGVFRTGHLPLATMAAQLVRDRPVAEAGYGRTADFAEAERVALFEAVERYNGMRPRRATPVLDASFAELGPERAVDPVRLGRYDPEHERHPRFHLSPYAPDVRTRWVHGWSYTHARPVAVPLHLAYWAVDSPGTARFLTETSNGCGLGNSLTEAVLHGLFEVAERDAFLMAWYARTPLRRIALPNQDPVLPHLADRLDSLGYELLFFDATNDLGIPAVLTLAKYHGQDHRPDRAGPPRAFFAAGAHPDPLAAMRSAAAEVVVDVESTVERVRAEPGAYRADRLRRLLAEPELIRTMADHVAVNGLPEAADRYDFLLSAPPGPVSPDGLGRPGTHTDLRRLLDGCVARLRALDLEVIAVDQTDPAIARRLGLHSAKVIVPGTLPMTFGQLYRRTLGLPRLLEVPHRLGRLGAVPDYESLALHPHPFP
jgi:ribosomal protein S12 methylthiotransferase accessory factor